MNELNITSQTAIINATENNYGTAQQKPVDGVIFIVDDDCLATSVNELLLKHCYKCRIVKFTNPRKVSEAAVNEPDLVGIVTDVMMLDDDLRVYTGIELARSLGQCGIKVPILFCTGLSGDKEIRAMSTLGLYINKGDLKRECELYVSGGSAVLSEFADRMNGVNNG